MTQNRTDRTEIRRMALIAMILLPLLMAGAPLCSEPRDSEPFYIDREGRIDENSILRKMEIEIGERINPLRAEEVATRSSLPGKKESADIKKERFTGSYTVNLKLKNRMVVEGKIILGQSQLLLFEKGEGELPKDRIRYRIPIHNIKSLSFGEWMPHTTGKKVYYLPHTCTVTTLEGHRYEGAFQPQDWLQVNLNPGSEGESYRTYYTGSNNGPEGDNKESGHGKSEVTGTSSTGEEAGKGEPIPETLLVGIDFHTPKKEDGPVKTALDMDR